MTTVVVISYSIIIWCSWKMCTFSKQSKGVTTIGIQYCKNEKDITRTLIVQALIPVITCLIPYILLIIIITAPANLFNPNISSIPSFMFSYIPLGNALSILIFVKPYKNQEIKLVKRVLRISESHVTPDFNLETSVRRSSHTSMKDYSTMHFPSVSEHHSRIQGF